MHAKSLRADMTLLLVAAIWGSGFVAQQVAARSMGPLAFNAARYAIGFGLLAALLAARRASLRPTRAELFGGIWLGLAMTGAAWLQQHGVEHTSAARAGFFTGLYVLLVPVIGLAFGQRARGAHVVGGAVAAAGLWLLSGEIAGGLRKGDPYIIACAALWALHVVLTGVLAPKASPLRLAVVQFGLVALVSASLALPLEADRFRPTGEGLVALAYSGVLVIGVAFTLQIVAQRHAPPTHAAVLMSTEAVFAAAFGVLLLSELLTGPEYIGCALMLAGCVLSQTLPHRRTRLERAALVKPVR